MNSISAFSHKLWNAIDLSSLIGLCVMHTMSLIFFSYNGEVDNEVSRTDGDYPVQHYMVVKGG